MNILLYVKLVYLDIMISYEMDESVERSLVTKSFKGFKLKKFPNLDKWMNCTLMIFSINPLENFQGMQSLPNLTDLYLDNTQLSSFLGAPDLPSLRTISIKSTPINAYKKADLMCAIAFGPQLVYINGEEIRRDRMRFANQHRDVLLPYLREGWLLTSMKPIRFIHSKTRNRITIKTPSPKFSFMNENLSNNSPKQTKEIDKETNNEDNDDNNADDEDNQSEIEEVHSQHTVYEVSEGNTSEEQNDTKAEKTMKNLNNKLTISMKKKGIQEKTVIDESENKKKYNNKEPIGMRHILRRPGGFKDPFTFNYAITVKQKPIPDLPPPIPRKPTLTVNVKPTSKAVQSNKNQLEDIYTPEESLNDSYSFLDEN